MFTKGNLSESFPASLRALWSIASGGMCYFLSFFPSILIKRIPQQQEHRAITRAVVFPQCKVLFRVMLTLHPGWHEDALREYEMMRRWYCFILLWIPGEEWETFIWIWSVIFMCAADVNKGSFMVMLEPRIHVQGKIWVVRMRNSLYIYSYELFFLI